MIVTQRSLGADKDESKKFINTPYIKFLYFFLRLIGTASVPLAFENILHFESLLIVKPRPIKKPHSAKLALAYIEQVGLNLHAWGINGEMQNLNIDIKNNAIYFGTAKMHLNTFFIVVLNWPC